MGDKRHEHRTDERSDGGPQSSDAGVTDAESEALREADESACIPLTGRHGTGDADRFARPRGGNRDRA
jgi:hypothetical protein